MDAVTPAPVVHHKDRVANSTTIVNHKDRVANRDTTALEALVDEPKSSLQDTVLNAQVPHSAFVDHQPPRPSLPQLSPTEQQSNSIESGLPNVLENTHIVDQISAASPTAKTPSCAEPFNQSILSNSQQENRTSIPVPAASQHVSPTNSLNRKSLDRCSQFQGESVLSSGMCDRNAPCASDPVDIKYGPKSARLHRFDISLRDRAEPAVEDPVDIGPTIEEYHPPEAFPPGPLEPALDDVEEHMARKVDSMGNILYIIILVVIIGSPLIVISALYGYWIVLSYITMGTCIAAAVSIGLINFVKRVQRSGAVLFTVSNVPENMTPTEYLRSMYLSTLGFDDGHDMIHKLAEIGIAVGLWALFSTLIFTTIANNIKFAAAGLAMLVVSIVVRFPFARKGLSSYVDNTYMVALDGRRYYNGKSLWPAIILFVLRVIFFCLGFISLVYYDGNFTELSGLFSTTKVLKWISVFVYVIITLLRDLVFLIPMSTRLEQYKSSMNFRAIALGVITIAQVIIAISACVAVNGYSSSMAVVASYLAIDFRHPRCSWTIYHNSYFQEHINLRAKRRGIKNTRSTLRVLGLILFIAITIGFFAGSTKTLPFSNLHQYGSPTQSYQKSKIKPPVCAMDILGLDIQDYAALALAAYDAEPINSPSPWIKRPHLANFTPGIYGSIDPTGKSFYIEFRAPAPSNLSIIAVRGTLSFTDIFQDIYMYSTSVLLQSSSYFGTLVNLWPVEITSLAVYLISSVGRPGLSLSYWTAVAKQVRLLQTQDGREVVITGHSLGGAIAGIVGSNMGIPAIGFSAPGLGFQTINYGFSLANLESTFVNIVPNHDVVPTFDVQYGFIQDISCYSGEPLSCHSLLLTQITLAELCN
ncbi:hypothetical protein BATDEDRAFT_24182 [Batrachochytrium dendrobatidis JAM81]|uniref:Fungal lipase-type domain-containing protein n=1 Tax=Batrachochytrium dendrobatidis (strain JAM81 / FGSC 10211) TaxID=684364 RepID=F4P0N6_BATDJ|nr:uncharacterized protein BATDEDRAFT_24182 [Batrachochytrium dendrobatidis JAM81]EGF81312.1 hypothetical protein BATDEDRAFT_24182 [Batrachochytrium dendrobatidis JAM81]|eukprot:XP_006677930.1 hypothetical protein BATDEDRAFT_24182 [Batrachochytrium dendrobatidis JAM81]